MRIFWVSLPISSSRKIAWVLKVIRELPFVPNQYFKKFVGTDDIWEVRVDSGNGTFRFLGFLDKGNFVILTNGFAKKTERTPPNEIRIADQRKRDYESRKNG